MDYYHEGGLALFLAQEVGDSPQPRAPKLLPVPQRWQAMADGSFPPECGTPDPVINVACFASAPWAKRDVPPGVQGDVKA